MLAVILAGGLGTRLRPLTLTTPKPLLPVANRPLIEHSMDALPKEVDEVVLAVGYKADMLEDHFRRKPRRQKVRVAVEDKPLGTGGAIRNALEQAGGARSTFIVRNADLVDTCPLGDMLAFHRRAHSLATISLWQVEDPSPFGVAKLEGSRITTFVEKPRRQDAPSNLVNAGTYVLEPEVLDYFPAKGDGELSIERTVFPQICPSPRGMHGFAFQGHWIDCGRPDSYLEAHRMMLGRGVTSAPGAVFRGQAKGFACLGPGAQVEEGAVVEDSVLLAGARVDRDAVVVKSIVGTSGRVRTKARIEDVVVGDGAEVAEGLHRRHAKIPDPKEAKA